MNFLAGYSTVMIGALTNDDVANAKNLIPNPLGFPLCVGALPALVGIPIVKWDLSVAGNTAMFGQLNIQGNILSGNNIVCEGEVASRSGGHILSAKRILIFLIQIKKDIASDILVQKVQVMMYTSGES